MTLLSHALILLTAVIHLFFFKLESVDFMQAKTLKRFGIEPEQAASIKTWAFNQGFYNLFLALGLFYAVFLLQGTGLESGKVLARFILLMIVAAGSILFISNPDKYPAALIQAVPALLAFGTTFIL